MTMQTAFPWGHPEKTLQDVIDNANPVVGVVHGSYNKPGQGVKHDAGKPKFDLIPFDLMDGEQRVWEKGAKKYAPNNWRRGMPMTQPLNAAMRHLTAYMAGQDLDPETGESHLDHLICCTRMAQNTAKYYPSMDDRNKWEPPKGE